MKKYVNDGPLDDAAARAAREQIITRFRFDPGKVNVQDALDRECERNPFDPVADYLESLVWDGEPRLDRWLVRYLGAEPTPLNRAFGRKTLLAAVRRVFDEGCKFDHLLVLEGPQGAGKSTAWRILAGDENFSDEPVKWDNSKQQREAATGVWIHEIGELVGLRKADVEAVKTFLSRQNDRSRAAYDRYVSDQKRRCIFVGTVNRNQRSGYLNDPTGARRFWPVACGRIDLEGLKGDRDQIWAEASYCESRGESLALPPELYGLAGVEQDKRRIVDPWLDILEDVKGTIEDGWARVSTMDLMMRDLGIERARVSPAEMSRVGIVMRQLGWDGPKVFRVGGQTVRGFDRRVT